MRAAKIKKIKGIATLYTKKIPFSGNQIRQNLPHLVGLKAWTKL